MVLGVPILRHFRVSNKQTISGDEYNNPGPGCSKLTMSLVNVSLKF